MLCYLAYIFKNYLKFRGKIQDIPNNKTELKHRLKDLWPASCIECHLYCINLEVNIKKYRT